MVRRVPETCRSNTTHGGHAAMAVKVGVMGAASDVELPEQMEKAHAVGRAAAERGCMLITGACPGLPLAAACGAKQAGGLVIGISPAMNLDEHLNKYQSPAEFHDVLIFTGSGLMGREVINIRSSDVVVIVGGRSGTLGELAIAYDEGKPIDVLTGMGGVGDIVQQILAVCAKDTGAKVVYDSNPKRLIEKLLRIHQTISVKRDQNAPSKRICGERGRPPAATVEDPVCHMRILPSAAVAQRVLRRRPYYFCSTTCAERFDADPSHYLRKARRHA